MSVSEHNTFKTTKLNHSVAVRKVLMGDADVLSRAARALSLSPYTYTIVNRAPHPYRPGLVPVASYTIYADSYVFPI